MTQPCSHVPVFTLNTGTADGAANAFYQALGLKPYDDMGLTGYLWPASRKG